MSDALKEAATTLWDRLIIAMRADGLLAHCVVQSGPATTAVLVDLAQPQAPWLGMHIHPQPGVEVVAIDNKDRVCVMTYNAEKGWMRGVQRAVKADTYRGWQFVRFTAVPP